jgi:ABC-type amino acid transport system permease subunit
VSLIVAIAIIVVLEVSLISFARRRAVRLGKTFKPWMYSVPLGVGLVVLLAAVTLLSHT